VINRAIANQASAKTITKQCTKITNNPLNIETIRGVNKLLMWNYLLALGHCLMFHNDFYVDISNKCTLCRLSPSVRRYQKKYSLGCICSYHSGEHLCLNESQLIMVHMFRLEDHCPFHKLGAVYNRRLYDKNYMNNGYGHKLCIHNNPMDISKLCLLKPELWSESNWPNQVHVTVKRCQTPSTENNPNADNRWGYNINFNGKSNKKMDSPLELVREKKLI